MIRSNLVSGLDRIAVCENLESRQFFSVGTDPTFHGGKQFVRFFNDADEEATAVVVVKGNRPLVAGMSTDGNGSPRAVFALFKTNGSLDPSFDGDGKLPLSDVATRRLGYVTDLKLLKDGSVLVVGTKSLLNLHTNGLGEPSFGNADFAQLPNEDYNAHTAVLADGSIRYASYDANTGALRVVNYSAKGKPVQSLKRTIQKEGANLLLTPTSEVVCYRNAVVRVYRPNLTNDASFGNNGTLDLKPAYTAWSHANGPWYDGEDLVPLPEIHTGGIRSGRDVYIIGGDVDAVSDHVEPTRTRHEILTQVFFYAAKTGTNVTVNGTSVDGTKLAATAFERYDTSGGDSVFGGTFTTTGGRSVFFEAEGFRASDLSSADDFAAAGNGQYYVVGGSFGDPDHENYGFVVAKTAFVG